MFNFKMLLLCVAMLLASFTTVLAEAATIRDNCQVGATVCDEGKLAIMSCGVLGWDFIQDCGSAGGACQVGPGGKAFCAAATTLHGCRHGVGMCDETRTSVMGCSVTGSWEPVEDCLEAGACHDDQAGYAFCYKPVVCTPGKSWCDGLGLYTNICTDEGQAQMGRMCHTLGCCEVLDGKAACRETDECAATLQPRRTSPPAKRRLHNNGYYAAAATNECQLGANKCDETNTSIMLCGFHGWQMIEVCPKVGGCHVGPAGNAFCDKQVECHPGQSQCDSANYVSKVCNHEGFWETDRKCSKPGCCEVRDGKAACKAQCGPGLEPPMLGS